MAAADHQTPINCRTCHNVHETYDAADMALTSNTPVTPWMGDVIGTTMTVDIGKGNLCANRHQPRSYDWEAELFGSGTSDTSSARKTTEDGSVTCHMAEPAYADEAGGHGWGMEYDDHGRETLWVEGCDGGCSGCHDVSLGGAEDVEAHKEMAKIWDDMDEDGVIDSTGAPVFWWT
jgi:hypothetical protein